jgi:hypothetical protein
MGLEWRGAQKKAGPRKVILEQGRRDRTRYTVIQTVNTLEWSVGRKIHQTMVQEMIDKGVEVVVKMRKG